jgi:type I restriction enzyme S subunit
MRWAGNMSIFREVPFRRVFQTIKRPVPQDAEMVTAFTDGTVTLRRNRRLVGYHQAADMSGYQGVARGDFVVHGLDILKGSAGVSDSTGAITSVCTVCLPRMDADSRYFGYVIRAQASTGLPRALARGVREGGADFRRWDTLAELPVPLPARVTQSAIADFLDRETQRIDRLVEKKRRLTELLEEKRAALINHAVTKGLDPTVPMKDSGIPWLGDIPAHWAVTKLTWVIDIAEGQVDPTIEPYASLPLIAPNHIRSGVGELIDVKTASEQGAISGKYLCRPGDVIYSKIRPALRKVTLAPDRCLCSADMYPMRARRALRPGFLRWWLLGDRFSTWAELVSERVAMPKVNREALTEVRLGLPPAKEQAAIDRWLGEQIDSSGRAIRLIEGQLDKLAEYRQALITAAVTGQIDVTAGVPEPEEVVA